MRIACLRGRPEIFLSLQGEGPSAGQPRVFARSSLCNLHCVWCDTDYTWNWEGTDFRHQRDAEPGYAKYHKQDQIIDLKPEEVAAEISRFGCQGVVLTGGEPLLQQSDWLEVIHRLRAQSGDYWFEVETNGTLLPSPDFDAAINQYNVAPKLANSGDPLAVRIQPAVFDFFVGSTKSNFKFVVSDPRDLVELDDLLSRFAIPSEKVYLMPEGTSAHVLDERLSWLWSECVTRGCRVSDRLHIRAHGQRRGV